MRIVFSTLLLLLVSLCVSLADGAWASPEDRQGEVDLLLNQLLRAKKDGASDQLRWKVRLRLLEIAGQSPEARSQVVVTLIRLLEDPHAIEQEGSGTAYRWTVAVEVLGDLGAPEAVDVLVKNLNEDGQRGVFLGSNYRPVAWALVKTGTKAVPGLIKALTDENPGIRHKAASTLAEIGPVAQAKLTEALRSGDAETKGGAALALIWIGGAEAWAAVETAAEKETNEEALKQLERAVKELKRRRGDK